MSQIIPIGIGSPAEIPQLVLTGLSPAVLPPPPTPGSSPGEFGLILSGNSYYSFNLFSSLIYTDGIELVLPARAVEVTWQTIYASPISITDIVLQVSVDGSYWATVDETTDVNGEVRTIRTSGRFIRAAMLDMEEGILTSVLIVAKACLEE